MNHEIIELACVAVGALALSLQTIVLFVLYLGLSKAAKSLKQDVAEMRSAVMPVLDQTRELLNRVGPKVESTVTDISTLTRVMREQSAALEATLDGILLRVRKQTSRVDGMFSDTLDAVDRVSVFVNENVSKPMRQVSGMLAAVKAIVESLRGVGGSVREPRLHDDKDIFV